MPDGRVNNGGAREGSGAPIKESTLARRQFRDELAKMIREEAAAWKDAIKDTALGHYAMTKTKDGEIKVYKKSPDVSAWNAAMDRAFGKPEQAVDVTSGGEKLNPLSQISDEAKEAMRQIYEADMRLKSIEGK